jgi:hypothetical protein
MASQSFELRLFYKLQKSIAARCCWEDNMSNKSNNNVVKSFARRRGSHIRFFKPIMSKHPAALEQTECMHVYFR